MKSYLYILFFITISNPLLAQSYISDYYNNINYEVDFYPEVDSFLLQTYTPYLSDRHDAPDTLIDGKALYLKSKQVSYQDGDTQLVTKSFDKDGGLTQTKLIQFLPDRRISQIVKKNEITNEGERLEYLYDQDKRVRAVIEQGDTTMYIGYSNGHFPSFIRVQAGNAYLNLEQTTEKKGDTIFFELKSDFSPVANDGIAALFELQAEAEPKQVIKLWPSENGYIYHEQTIDRKSERVLTTKEYARSFDGRLLMYKDTTLSKHFTYQYEGDKLISIHDQVTDEVLQIKSEFDAFRSLPAGTQQVVDRDTRGNPVYEAIYDKVEGEKELRKVTLTTYWYRRPKG